MVREIYKIVTFYIVSKEKKDLKRERKKSYIMCVWTERWMERLAIGLIWEAENRCICRARFVM